MSNNPSIHTTQIEQYDSDIADDDLERIVRLKEDLTDWLDSCRKMVESMPKRFLSPHMEEFMLLALSYEEQFDDLFHHEWHRLNRISGSVQWPTEIPSCNTLRAQLAGSRLKLKQIRQTQNPATFDAK